MSNNQLISVNVKGYKSIKDQEISLANINVLIGQNGAGKSNFNFKELSQSAKKGWGKNRTFAFSKYQKVRMFGWFIPKPIF